MYFGRQIPSFQRNAVFFTSFFYIEYGDCWFLQDYKMSLINYTAAHPKEL
jgi:hypothetical protein